MKNAYAQRWLFECFFLPACERAMEKRLEVLHETV